MSKTKPPKKFQKTSTFVENVKNPGFTSKGKIDESDLYLNSNIDSVIKSREFKSRNILTKLDMSINSKWISSSEEETTPPVENKRKISSKNKEEEKKPETKNSPNKSKNADQPKNQVTMPLK